MLLQLCLPAGLAGPRPSELLLVISKAICLQLPKLHSLSFVALLTTFQLLSFNLIVALTAVMGGLRQLASPVKLLSCTSAHKCLFIFIQDIDGTVIFMNYLNIMFFHRVTSSS